MVSRCQNCMQGEGNSCWISKLSAGAHINGPTMTPSRFLTSLVQIRGGSYICSGARRTPILPACPFWTLYATGTRLQIVLKDRIYQRPSGFSCPSKNQTPKFVLTSAVSIFLTKTSMLLKRQGQHFFSKTQPLTLYRWYLTHIKSKLCSHVDDKANIAYSESASHSERRSSMDYFSSLFF